jgi:hypothetical protein
MASTILGVNLADSIATASSTPLPTNLANETVMIVKRDCATLGPTLKGKIHIYVGSADNYFLNDAVYYVEDFLKRTVDPPYTALPNAISRLHYNTQYVPKILERMQKPVPPGADLTSWRY